MQIGGFIKQSFVDWPGKIASVVFTRGCNFRCVYCHNPTLVLPELYQSSQALQQTDIFSYLEQRKNWLDGVVISGGEPTIHSNLPDFIIRIKEMDYLVKLDTNGTNPEMLEMLIRERLIDFVAMDIKHLPATEPYEMITQCPVNLEKITRSIHLIRKGNISCMFRTTAIPEIHSKNILQSVQCWVAPHQLSINEYNAMITLENELKKLKMTSY
jgi:pyruvate formate lyase activating enzyme